MYVVVETYGEDLVAAELLAIGDRAVDMTPLWPAMITKLQNIEREQFATDGARSGNLWPPLDTMYMWKKFKAGLSLDIMKATEALYAALTGPSPDATRIGTPTTLQFGASDLQQFRVHQDYNPSSTFPQRTPIDLTQGDVADFAMVMLEYVMGTRNRAGAAIRGGTGRGRGTFRSGRNPLA